MRKLKAMLIDPFGRKVTALVVTDDVQAIYDAIGADCFCALNLDDRDTMYLDDEGIYRAGQEFFAIGDYPHPLAGKGLVLGYDEEGESVSAAVQLAELQRAVRWLSAEEAVEMNNKAAAAMHAAAAVANASHGGGFAVVVAPPLEIDPETGKARVL